MRRNVTVPQGDQRLGKHEIIVGRTIDRNQLVCIELEVVSYCLSGHFYSESWDLTSDKLVL